MNDKYSEKLNKEEKALLSEWKNLFLHVKVEDKRELPSSFMNLWLGNSGVSLVRHANFLPALEKARIAKTIHL